MLLKQEKIVIIIKFDIASFRASERPGLPKTPLCKYQSVVWRPARARSHHFFLVAFFSGLTFYTCYPRSCTISSAVKDFDISHCFLLHLLKKKTSSHNSLFAQHLFTLILCAWGIEHFQLLLLQFPQSLLKRSILCILKYLILLQEVLNEVF